MKFHYLLFVMMLFLGGCYAPPEKAPERQFSDGTLEDFSEVSEFLEALKAEEEQDILYAFDQVPSWSGSSDFLSVVLDLWNKDYIQYPGVSTQVLEMDGPRIRMAERLMQADLNGVVKAPRDEIRVFLLRFLNTDDFYLFAYSMLALGYLDNAEDVPLILDRAKREEPVFFQTAVSTLSSMCNPQAQFALDELEKDLKGSEFKSFFIKARSTGLAHKKEIGLCGYKAEREYIADSEPYEEPDWELHWERMAAKEAVTVESLKETLRTKNLRAIDEMLTLINFQGPQENLLFFIEALWDEEQTKYPDLPWATIKSDKVRIQIADMLIQATIKSDFQGDMNQYRAFFLALFDTGELDIKRSVLIPLAFINDERDVEKFVSLAKGEKEYFLLVVLSLSLMCNETATEALIHLSEVTEDPDNLRHVEDLLKEHRKNLQIASWCNPS